MMNEYKLYYGVVILVIILVLVIVQILNFCGVWLMGNIGKVAVVLVLLIQHKIMNPYIFF